MLTVDSQIKINRAVSASCADEEAVDEIVDLFKYRAKPLGQERGSGSPTGEVADRSTCVSVIGSRCLGEAEPEIHLSATELARLAKVEFMTVRLQGDAERKCVHSVELVPDLRDATILKAVQNHFLS